MSFIYTRRLSKLTQLINIGLQLRGKRVIVLILLFFEHQLSQQEKKVNSLSVNSSSFLSLIEL